MSNNLDAQILNVKLIKWSLNRINYYYKTLYTNLHYFNVSVGQSERHRSNSFTCMHLADTYIQSDLQYIQVIHLLSVCVFPGN